jgi:hypothetical protein
MPIKGWSDGQPRLPRLGNIALGEKTEKGTPVALDYFVVPPEVQQVYGPTPRELDVVLPSDDIETVMPCYLKRYGKQFGLICRGDGEYATVNENYVKKNAAEYGININGGNYYSGDGEKLEIVQSGGRNWVKIPCMYQSCPHYAAKRCREVAILSVILYKVPGVLGVYSLDTGSFNSYQNISNSIQMLHQMLGRASYIPMKLKVRMQTVNPAIEKEGNLIQIQRQVPVIYLDMGDYTLERVIQLARERRLTTTALALPPVQAVDMEPPNEDEQPELLYPEVLEPEEETQTENTQPPEQPETPQKPPQEEPQQPKPQQSNDDNTYLIKAAKPGATPQGKPFIRLALENKNGIVDAVLPGNRNPQNLIGKKIRVNLVQKAHLRIAENLQVIA